MSEYSASDPKPGADDSWSGRVASLQAEVEALRELMNVYNLGGWTDAVEPMKRALQAERDLAEARQDAERLGWLDAHPREATIRVGTDIKPCVFWGVSAAPGVALRAAIDAARSKEQT